MRKIGRRGRLHRKGGETRIAAAHCAKGNTSLGRSRLPASATGWLAGLGADDLLSCGVRYLAGERSPRENLDRRTGTWRARQDRLASVYSRVPVLSG
jgi:hypothetical protein